MASAEHSSLPTDASREGTIPEELPFLEKISWFDSDYRNLAPLDMLRRYEAGWRYRGVLGEPSATEARFIKTLALRYGSVLDV